MIRERIETQLSEEDGLVLFSKVSQTGFVFTAWLRKMKPQHYDARFEYNA